MSKKMAVEVGIRLGMTASEVAKLMEESTESFKSQQVKEDVFLLISDWLHFAVLELIKTEGFRYRPKAVARRFATTAIEIEMVFERLARLGFLEVSENGKVTLLRPNNNWFNHEGTTEARKIMQKQLLKKASEAIDNVDFSERSNSALTVAVNPKDIPKFKKHIQEFLDETDQLIERTAGRKEVYQICVAFFPLTTTEEN